MVRMNARFADFLAAARKPILGELHPALAPIAREGIVKIGRLYFLKSFIRQRSTAPKELDEIGVEHWVNHFHLDDYVAVDHLQQSLRFMNQVFEQWNRRRSVGVLNSLVALAKNGKSAVLSFHLVRPGQTYLDDDLEGYRSEAILEISSRDVSFFKLL
jgi:hypothetical protein